MNKIPNYLRYYITHLMQDFIQSVAQQLRKPEGDMGKEIGERMNQGNCLMNKNTIQLLTPAAGDHILEIGMGNGFFIKDIVSIDMSIRYTGCDYSELMVTEAMERNREFIEKGQVRIVHGQADALPFPDAVFNKVFTINTIYFWEDPLKELAEIHRVLQPGGSLIIAIRPASTMQHIPFTQYGFTLYEKENIFDLLVQSGFTVNSVGENEEPVQEMHGNPMQMNHTLITASATNF